MTREFKLLEISPSTRRGKKFMAVFENTITKRLKTTHFGAAGMSDYTIHKDKQRQQRYINRHDNGRETWEDPTTAGSLSRWVLWNKPDFNKSVKDYIRKFKL